MTSRRGQGKAHPEPEEAEMEEDEDEEEEEDGSEEEEDEEGGSSDEDDDDEDDESSEEEEDNEVPIEESLAFGREKRATQGKRMQTLVGEEQEKDEEFWGDEKWKEDDAESEYSNESESADEVDSDFDAEEAAESEGEDSEAEAAAAAKEKRASKAKASKYKEPARPKLPKPALTPEEEARLKEERKEAARLRKEAAALANLDRAKRASTQTKTARAAQERERKDREQAKQRQLAPPKPRATKCTFTQEELLLEACSTEQENAKWLLGRKRMQDETDDAAHAPKRQVKLAARFISRRACPNVVNFPQVEDMPAVLRDSAEQDEELERQRAEAAERPRGKTVCVVTGLLARYRDPQTGLPYANAEAFRALRANPQKYAAQARKRARTQQEPGAAGDNGKEGLGVSRASSQSSFG